MEEKFEQLIFRFNELEKVANYNQQNLMLTWAILSVIVAVLALVGYQLIKNWVNEKVSKELEPIKNELIQLQEVNKQLINDYNQLQEYGTWTPYLEKGSHHYLKQYGRYYKIGNIVILWIDLQVVGKDELISGNIAINGLPFISDESINCICNLINYKSVDSEGEEFKLSGYIQKCGTTLYLTELGNGLNPKTLEYSSTRNIFSLSGTIVYKII